MDGLAPDEFRALLVEHHFHEPFPPSGFGDLLSALQHIRLAAGETLLEQGQVASDLFLVLRGRLAMAVGGAGGRGATTEKIGPGGVVGEIALLTGQPWTASVHAVEASDVARLARADFERLAERYPEALNEFLRRILPQLRRAQVVSVLTELFGELAEPALKDLQSKLEWLQLGSGELLFRKGDRSDDVYIVVNGRLRVVTVDLDGREQVLEEVGRGGAVGELALLTGETRAASVLAVRDTDLLRLTNAAFDQLLDTHPRAMMQIARAAATRLRRTAGFRRPQRYSATRSFALIPAQPGLALDAFARELAAALSESGTTLRLGSADVDRLLAQPGIAQSGDESVIHEAIVAWLSCQEREHEYLILEADSTLTPWTRRCLRQADRVLYVADSAAPPALGEIEAAIGNERLQAQCELVLLHPGSRARPVDTASWLAPRKVAMHHHVRLGRRDDLRRLGRRISGRATGLVLGGGGARGFVHIGALRALAEAGIEIDIVGGTSIGALIAAAHTVGFGVDEMVTIARSFASRKKLLDRTMPITSLMAGRKVTKLYQELFGDQRVEDQWLPLFAVSSGLSRAQAVVHRTGAVWEAVRASTAIPAIFPPILGNDLEVLVDGNVMNNMPLDVMSRWCEGGTVIGVNPMPTADKLTEYRFGPSLTGWEALMGRLKWFGSRTRAPSILGLAMRATEINSANRMRMPSFRALADVLIEPPVGSYQILAFEKYEPIVQIGYEAARDDIARWRAQAAEDAKFRLAAD